MEGNQEHAWLLLADYISSAKTDFQPEIVKRLLIFLRRRQRSKTKHLFRKLLKTMSERDDFALEMLWIGVERAPPEAVETIIEAFI